MERVAEIRFKGYTDGWVQHKVGDLLKTLPFKQFIKEPEQNGEYEIIQQGNESVIGFANGTPCGDYKDVVIFGDHTLSLYKPKHPFFVATDGVRIVKGQQDTDGYYLFSLLERYKPQSEGYKRYYNILVDILCSTTYNTIEQEQIGVLFKQLDNLIILQQRKCDNIKKLKKYMLQKMFPQDGNKKPEIRFNGFTVDWVQCKLGEVAKFRQGVQVDLEKQYTEETDNRERFIRIVDYTQGTNDIRYIDKIGNANHVDEKDVVVVRYGATVGFIGHGITGIIANNMFTISPSEELNKEFLYTYMKQDNMYNYLNYSNGSSAMPAISFGIMTSLNITYPNNDEQGRVADYFRNLDHLITLNERKLNKLKQIKKALLNKMFV